MKDMTLFINLAKNSGSTFKFLLEASLNVLEPGR